MLETVHTSDQSSEKMTMRRQTAEHPWHHQVLDGSNALLTKTAAESCTRWRRMVLADNEARDGDHRRGRAAPGLGRLSRGAPRFKSMPTTPEGASGAVREPILFRSVLHDRRSQRPTDNGARYRPLSTQPGPKPRTHAPQHSFSIRSPHRRVRETVWRSPVPGPSRF